MDKFAAEQRNYRIRPLVMMVDRYCTSKRVSNKLVSVLWHASGMHNGAAAAPAAARARLVAITQQLIINALLPTTTRGAR